MFLHDLGTKSRFSFGTLILQTTANYSSTCLFWSPTDATVAIIMHCSHGQKELWKHVNRKVVTPFRKQIIMEMVICQETPSHGKKIYGNLTAARHAPSKKVQITRYYVIWMCTFLSVKKNYGKIGPRRAAVVCWPMPNLFSISIILSTTISIFRCRRSM